MDAQFALSFREVIPDQTNLPAAHRKDITLNTGASQSTLQDIKVAERAGGFCYADATSVHTRNRFIHWRTQHDVLELIETSLDANLVDSHVRYRFADAPVLAVSVHEAVQQQQVVLLVVTVSSIHRLSYTHPEMLARRAGGGGGGGMQTQPLSVFHEASMQATRDPSTYHVIGHVGGGASSTAIPHTATAWLTASGQEALFSLAYQSQLLLFTMHTGTGQTVVAELKQHTIVPRIFSNLTGVLRGKPSSNDSQFAVSMVFGDCGPHSFLYALYRDDHVRMWSVRSGQCVATVNAVPETNGGETRPQGPQQNILRRCLNPAAPSAPPTLCAFLSHSLGSEFITMHTALPDGTDAATHSPPEPGRYLLQLGARLPAAADDLVDFELDAQRVWALWCTAHGDFTCASHTLSGDCAGWQPATLEPPTEPIAPPTFGGADPKETYSAHIFHPGRFQRDVIAKALLMFGRVPGAGLADGGSGGGRGSTAAVVAATAADTAQLSVAVLRDRVCAAIELEISAELAAYEGRGSSLPLSDEEVVELAARHWERFYECAEQYHVKLAQPIGLFGLASLGAVCVVRKRTFSLLRPCELLEHLMMQADEDGRLDGQVGGEELERSEVLAVHERLQDLQRTRILGVEEAADVVRLVHVLAALEAQLGEDVKRDVHDRLYQLHMPNVVVAEMLASAELEETVFTRDFVQAVQQEVGGIGDVKAAMSGLLVLLQLDAIGDDGEMANYSQTPRTLLALGNLFGGDLGVSTLAECLKQVALVRYALCRNLLVLQQLLVDRFDVGCDVLEEVRSNCMPNTVVYVQAYYVMVWLCEIPVQSGYATATLDHNIQRLNVLQISAASRRIIRPQQPITLLEFFLRSRGLQAGWLTYVQANPKQRDAEDSDWSQTLLPLVNAVGQLIWSVSGPFTFGEWLIGSCQHILIQEYVRLLNGWCEWNSCSRQFIAAVTLLETGEPAKAYDLFMQSAKGVCTEPFLEQCIISADMHASGGISDLQAMTAYYLRIIQLFEQHGCLDLVIALAKAAIGLLVEARSLEPAAAEETAGDDEAGQQLAMFQSIVFANHLQLEHYDEAYHALIDNADAARRKDCLRQLVLGLFAERRLDWLMRFPYVRLQAELEEIVEARARAVRIEANPYYDFLYAFHVTKGNMRRAAAIQYEQAMRLQAVCDGTEAVAQGGDAGAGGGTEEGARRALQSRYECLLSCQNSLHLVDERYAWLAKPVAGGQGGADELAERFEDGDGMMDTAEGGGGDGRDGEAPPPQRVAVLELADLRAELAICAAQLTLLRHRPDLPAASVHVSAEQICAVLSASGLYTAAIKLARGAIRNGTSGGSRQRLRCLSAILEHLAAACVRADDSTNPDETWLWLKENDLADVPHRNCAAEMAWLLLRRELAECEAAEECGDDDWLSGYGGQEGGGGGAADCGAQRIRDGNEPATATSLHRAVVVRLLSAGVFLPHWLQQEYRRRRPAELLRLLVAAGRLLEAGALCCEYVWAMMTVGGEYFGLRNSLHSTKAALCFPVSAVDELLQGLEANVEAAAAGQAGAELAEEYAECLREVREVVERYVETAQRVSANRVEYRGQEAVRAAVEMRAF